MPIYQQPAELKLTSSDQEVVAAARSNGMSGVDSDVLGAHPPLPFSMSSTRKTHIGPAYSLRHMGVDTGADMAVQPVAVDMAVAVRCTEAAVAVAAQRTEAAEGAQAVAAAEVAAEAAAFGLQV